MLPSAVNRFHPLAPLLLSATLAAPAKAELVYLDCLRPSDSTLFQITLNEPASEVTVFIPKSGYSETRKASFGREVIQWSESVGSGITATTTINRVTGVRSRTVLGKADYSECKVITERPATKF